MMKVLGVAAWLLAWSTSVGPDPTWVGTSSEPGAVTEGEVWFPSPVTLVVPETLPLEEGSQDRFALLVWSLEGGEERACAYVSDAERYGLAACDGAVAAGSSVRVDYVAVWSDVAYANKAPGGRIFIDFTGGGIVLRCDGVTHYLGDVEPSSIDLGAYCSAG